MNRVVCLVDGFNLYHSLREVERGHGHSLRWLDLNALCSSLLHAVPGRCEVAGIVYFSAMARHREAARPGAVARHLRYVDALQATGVETILGHFKRRQVRCPYCGRVRDRWEEKQTDVGIAVRLVKLAATDACERVLVVSGSTPARMHGISSRRSSPVGTASGSADPAAGDPATSPPRPASRHRPAAAVADDLRVPVVHRVEELHAGSSLSGIITLGSPVHERGEVGRILPVAVCNRAPEGTHRVVGEVSLRLESMPTALCRVR